MIRNKPILDACCGSRMFWFDKKNSNAIFMDNRNIETTLCDGRTLEIKPDVVGDFRNMPFEDDEIQIENGEKARSALSKIEEVL